MSVVVAHLVLAGQNNTARVATAAPCPPCVLTPSAAGSTFAAVHIALWASFFDRSTCAKTSDACCGACCARSAGPNPAPSGPRHRHPLHAAIAGARRHPCPSDWARHAASQTVHEPTHARPSRAGTWDIVPWVLAARANLVAHRYLVAHFCRAARELPAAPSRPVRHAHQGRLETRGGPAGPLLAQTLRFWAAAPAAAAAGRAGSCGWS